MNRDYITKFFMNESKEQLQDLEKKEVYELSEKFRKYIELNIYDWLKSKLDEFLYDYRNNNYNENND